MALLIHDYSHSRVRGLVAKVLLDSITNTAGPSRQLSQRDIASLTGSDWETVHTSLKSLQDCGAIKIDRNRLIINKELLQKLAGATTEIADKAI